MREKVKEISKKAAIGLTTSGIAVAVTMTNALASGTNTYAQNAATWVLDGVFWLVVVLGIAGAGMSFVKRNVTAGIGIIIGAAVIAVLCKNPTVLETLGNTLKGILGL